MSHWEVNKNSMIQAVFITLTVKNHENYPKRAMFTACTGYDHQAHVWAELRECKY